MFAQRCAGYIAFRMADTKEKIIYPLGEASTSVAENSSVHLCDSAYLNEKIKIINSFIDGNVNSDCPDIIKENDTFYFKQPTGCGVKLWRFSVTSIEQTMTIEIRNAKIEREYLLDSIPFMPGEYYIELEEVNDEKLKTSTSNEYPWLYGIAVNASNYLKKK